MNWKEYLKSQGYTDAEIGNMATTFGEDKMAKAFEQPIRDKVAAEAAATSARADKEEFERFYNEEVLPKVSTVYQDAINSRTRAAALEERLKSARDFGFLSDPNVLDGIVPGVPVPGSPAAPGSPASPGAPAGPTPLDKRYVSADMFTEQVTNIPTMLANLTKISNEHFSLFGSPLLDIDDLVKQAQDSKGKVNVRTVWEQKYKVGDKRSEIEKAKQDEHDKKVAAEAISKYVSDHSHPFTGPARPSIAPTFTPKSVDDARHPWKGAGERKGERRTQFLDAMGKQAVAGHKVQ